MPNHHRRDARLETVALRLVAGAQAQHLHRHHGAAVQRQQAVRRPHKMHAAPARQFAIGLQLVAHHLRDRQFGQCLFQGFLQAAAQSSAGDQAVIEKCFVFAVGCSSQRGDRSHRIRQVRTQRLQLFEQGWRGLACGVKSDGGRHQFLRHGLVGGLAPDLADVCCQPARRRKRRHHRIRCGQPLGPQLSSQLLGKSVTQLLKCLRWQLFDKQFHKQVVSAHHAAFFVICSTQARGAIGKPSRSRLSK